VSIFYLREKLTGQDRQRVAPAIRKWQRALYQQQNVKAWAESFAKLEPVLRKTRPTRPVILYRAARSADEVGDTVYDRFTSWTYEPDLGFKFVEDAPDVMALVHPEDIVMSVSAFGAIDHDQMSEAILRPGRYTVVLKDRYKTPPLSPKNAPSGLASGRAGKRSGTRSAEPAGTRARASATPRISFRLDPDNFSGGYYVQPRGRLIAVVDGQDAGFLDFLRYPKEGGVTAEFLSVKKPFRNMGVGEALLIAFKKYLRKNYPSNRLVFTDATSRRSLRVVMRAYGAPAQMDNGIRMITLREAFGYLPEALEVNEHGMLEAGTHIRLAFDIAGRKRTLGLDELPKGFSK
jgi:hypothetical protein